MAKDPVCNMEVDERDAEYTSQYGGKIFYFCSERCREKFEDHPEQYAVAA